MASILIHGVTGGLGPILTREALLRGHRVSVLARNRSKIDSELGAETVSKLAEVHIGQGDDVNVLRTAFKNKDVVINALGANTAITTAFAQTAKAEGIKKMIQVAGASNVMSEDGVTLMWKLLVDKFPAAESFYKAHQPGIDAIISSGVNFVVFCPGLMNSKGAKSDPPVGVRVNRPSGDYVSYEDAAVVIVDAVEKSEWDGQLITAATKR